MRVLYNVIHINIIQPKSFHLSLKRSENLTWNKPQVTTIDIDLTPFRIHVYVTSTHIHILFCPCSRYPDMRAFYFVLIFAYAFVTRIILHADYFVPQNIRSIMKQVSGHFYFVINCNCFRRAYKALQDNLLRDKVTRVYDIVVGTIWASWDVSLSIKVAVVCCREFWSMPRPPGGTYVHHARKKKRSEAAFPINARASMYLKYIAC